MTGDTCELCGIHPAAGVEIQDSRCLDIKACNERHALNWAVASDLQRAASCATGDGDFDELLAQCVAILGSKGRDYTAGSANKLANFDAAGEFLGLEPRQVLGVYLYKHMASVLAYCQHGTLESEPIASRLADVINYCLLLHKMVNREALSKRSERNE